MSWSVNAKGKPSEVLENLATQFKNAKASTASVPVEQKSVEQAEEQCKLLVGYLVETDFPWVEVSGYGSGCVDNSKVTNGWRGNVSFNLTVTPINKKE